MFGSRRPCRCTTQEWRQNYRTLISQLCKTSPEIFTISDSSAPENIIAGYILLLLRALYLRQAEIADNALNARKVFIKIFGKALEEALFSVIMKISNAKRPKDVLDLVDQIIELLEQYAVGPQFQNGSDDAVSDAPNNTSGDAPGTPSGSPDDEQTPPRRTDADNLVEADSADTDNAQMQGSDQGQPEAESYSDKSSRAAIKDALGSTTEVSDLGGAASAACGCRGVPERLFQGAI